MTQHNVSFLIYLIQFFLINRTWTALIEETTSEINLINVAIAKINKTSLFPYKIQHNQEDLITPLWNNN